MAVLPATLVAPANHNRDAARQPCLIALWSHRFRGRRLDAQPPSGTADPASTAPATKPHHAPSKNPLQHKA
jgi:hypothetical protein